jgi:flagellar biogenesis protein FliO
MWTASGAQAADANRPVEPNAPADANAPSATTRPTSRPSVRGDEPGPLWWGKDANAPTPGVSSDMLSRLTVSVVVVGVLGVVAWVAIKKLGPRVGLQSGRTVNVVETVYLGPKKCLHLVEIDGQRLLLGSTADRVSMLSHLQPSETAEDEPTFQMPEEPRQDPADERGGGEA